MPDVLTVEQAAAYLQVHVETVRRHCRDQLIPAAKVGRGWRIRKVDLDEFLARGGAIQDRSQKRLAV